MPVAYSLDRERALVRTTCLGYITFDEVMKHFQALEGDPRRVGRFNVLIDLRNNGGGSLNEAVAWLASVSPAAGP